MPLYETRINLLPVLAHVDEYIAGADQPADSYRRRHRLDSCGLRQDPQPAIDRRRQPDQRRKCPVRHLRGAFHCKVSCSIRRFRACEALDKVETALANDLPYAMAFIDMRMPPGWDGLETIERLWQVDPKLQVALCTAYSDYSWEDIDERLELGDRLLILKKPFDAIEIRQMASALTAKWQMTEDAALKMSLLEQAVEERTRELSDANIIVQNSPTILYRLRGEPSFPLMYISHNITKYGHIAAALVASANWAQELIHPDDQSKVDTAMARVLDRHAAGASIEFRMRTGNGAWRWVENRYIPVRDDEGRLLEVEGIIIDITERKLAEEKIALLARTDGLTGLANRATLIERLHQAFAAARRGAATVRHVLPGPGSLQTHQRHPGPPGGRPVAARGRPPDQGLRARKRCGRPPGR